MNENEKRNNCEEWPVVVLTEDEDRCLGCDHYLGNGHCKIGLELECRDGGGYQAFRQKATPEVPDGIVVSFLMLDGVACEEPKSGFRGWWERIKESIAL